MNSLVNRAIEEFLRSTYGDGLLQSISDEAAIPRHQEHDTAALERAALRLAKPPSEMLEDLGAWMTRIESIRRLLRFSGRDFEDFLLRLDELPGRAHLVLPMLKVPRLQVETRERTVRVVMLDPDTAWQFVLVGLIRGMADDYGALSLISVEDGAIRIEIWDERFAEGRVFSLHGAGELGAAAS